MSAAHEKRPFRVFEIYLTNSTSLAWYGFTNSKPFLRSLPSSWISYWWICQRVRMSCANLWGVMRLRVLGLFRVVTLATALPPLNVVTVTLETWGFFGAALRALVLRAGFALAVETVADLADAGILDAGVCTPILYMRSLDSLPLSPNT